MYFDKLPFSDPNPTRRPSRSRSRTFSTSSVAGKRGRQAIICSRGRARGICGESGLSELVLDDDDDDETSEDEGEAAILQSESSKDGDDDVSSDSANGEAVEAEEGSGSDSNSDLDSGADRDSASESAPPKKRTNKASRA